jgi:hypothetical protein
MSGRRLSSPMFALPAILILLALVDGPPGQAAPGKKPVPEPIWAAQIPAYGNLMSMGEGHLYKSGDPYVRVTVQKATTGGAVTRTTVHFFIYPSANPPEVWARFTGIDFLPTLGDPGPLAALGLCGFPPDYCLGSQGADFLGFVNSEHPKPGYEHLLFNFWFDGDFEDAVRYPAGLGPVQYLGSGTFNIFFWNNFDPLSAADPEPYETVTARLVGGDNTEGRGLFIEKIGDNAWEFTIERKLFAFSQHYSWIEPGIGRNGKPATVHTSWEPLSGEQELSFKIRLVKNPS